MALGYTKLPFFSEFNREELADKILVVCENSTTPTQKVEDVNSRREEGQDNDVNGNTSLKIDSDILTKEPNIDPGYDNISTNQGMFSTSLANQSSSSDANVSILHSPSRQSPDASNGAAPIHEIAATDGISSPAISECEITTETADQDEMRKENKYFVHSFLLSLHSDYFRLLFVKSGMKETSQKEVKITIGEGESCSFKKFLEAMYSPDSLDDLERSEIFQIMALADRYCCNFLIEKCHERLGKYEMGTVDDLNQVYEAVSPFWERPKLQESMKELRKICTEKLLLIFSPLEKKLNSSENHLDNFVGLGEIALKELLKATDLEIQSENSVLSCVLKWAEVNKPRESVLQELLEHIDIRGLSSNYLLDIITPKHEILSKLSCFNEWFIEALSYRSCSDDRRATYTAKTERIVKPDTKIADESTFTGTQACSKSGNAYMRHERKGHLLLCEGYFYTYEVWVFKDNKVYVHLTVPDLAVCKKDFSFKAHLELELYSNGKPIHDGSRSLKLTNITDFDSAYPLKGQSRNTSLYSEMVKAKLEIKMQD